jgi:2-polyprenyl-3-methyl-5-hydroxy-6-metoxy-1,4-benzoquinol methylase
MDQNDWNVRHAAREIDLDVKPAAALAAEFGHALARGRALDLGCGQGRNAVWLAERGWRVTAVDYSEVAINRGRQLAAAKGVDVEWIEADVMGYVAPAGVFQLVVIAYLQIPGSQRRKVLTGAAAVLASGGTLFMVGHARLNLTEGTGGPKNPDLLWDPAEIERELTGLGLVVQRVEHVYRSAETPDGVGTAIDTVARAERR